MVEEREEKSKKINKKLNVIYVILEVRIEEKEVNIESLHNKLYYFQFKILLLIYHFDITNKFFNKI